MRNAHWCGKPLHNAAIIARDGKILLEQHKTLLPTYDVFDELRYFEPGAQRAASSRSPGIASACRSARTSGSTTRSFGTKLYCRNPVDELARQGAEVLLNISASPFNAGKRRARWEIFSRIAKRYDAPLVYVNQVGGNDELLFDGSSIVFDKTGQTIFCAPAFEEHGSLVQSARAVRARWCSPSARRKRSPAR